MNFRFIVPHYVRKRVEVELYCRFGGFNLRNCSFHSFGSCFNNSSSQLCESILEMENALIAGILGSRLRRRRLLNLVQLLHRRRAVLLRVVLLPSLLLLSSDENEPRVRSCRRDTRNDGWFVKVWTEYSDKRFKESLPVPRHCQ